MCVCHHRFLMHLIQCGIAVFVTSATQVGYSAQQRAVSGRAYVDGEPASAIRIQVFVNNEVDQEVVSEKDGQFHFTVAQDLPVILLPKNEGYFAHEFKNFLVGGAVVNKDAEVKLSLSTKPLMERLVVLDGKQQVDWSSTAVSYEVNVSMGDGLPDWTIRQTLRAGDMGELRLKIPQVTAKHSFEIYSELPNHMLATASKQLTTQELMQVVPYRLQTDLQHPSLVINTKWIEKVGGGPVKRVESDDIFAYGLTLAPGKQTALIDERGIARFYGVKPGKHTISFTAVGEEQFTIVPPSESVEILPDEIPRIHELKIKPKVVQKISGIVIQKGSTLGVSTATIEADGMRVLTDHQGRFKLRSSGSIDSLRVEHKDYEPTEIEAPFEIPLIVPLQKWPKFSGQVSVNGTPVKNSKLRLYTTDDVKSIRIRDNGEWSEPLKPGKYFMTLRAWDVSDNAGEDVTPNEMTSVLLYSSTLEFDSTVNQLKIDVTNLHDVVVYSKTETKSVPDAYVAMLLNKDRRILMSTRFGKGETSFKVVPGEYKLAVIYTDRSAKIVDINMSHNEKTILTVDGASGRSPTQIRSGYLTTAGH